MVTYPDITSLSDPALLERVDKLRSLNIGQHVPLPQLVAVGDQSSGKSSLLESISGFPFPKDQSLCTRHATQITSRRTDTDCITISIIPGPRASEQHKKQLESFSVEITSRVELQEQFMDILKKANEKMGLRTNLTSEDGARFSEDILKIEILGPREEYLTIIDVPGIFRTTTQGTTKEDMAMVKDLVKRYIKDDRTIILAVLPSNVDIATQEILELAEEYDQNGERTLGVLTKPDLVSESSMQTAVCDLVMGKTRPLLLGYFLIRNRGMNSDLMDQEELDTIFQRQPWVDLPPDRVGISALKEQLRNLLVEITRREFPKMAQDINNQIREGKRELNSMGPPRADDREQRRYLSHIAESFQDIARAALDANYNANPKFDQDELRLITHVANITDVFNADFQERAHSQGFETVDKSEMLVSVDGFVESDSEDALVEQLDNLRLLLRKAKVDDITPEEHIDLGDIVDTSYEPPMPYGDLTSWINGVYFRSRGLDLGTFNPHLVTMSFVEQSRKWDDMTKLYISRIIITIHRFIASALNSVCSENQVREQLWSTILEDLVSRYNVAMKQAYLLIEVEKRKSPYTLNRQFSQLLSKVEGYRMTELLRPKARKDTKQYGEVQNMVNLDDIASASEGSSNAEKLQERIHDILYAYYGLALNRFIDNVFQIPVDYYLLRGPSSPLKVFNQDWVIHLEPEELERIAGESKSEKKRRNRLKSKISDLSKGLDILKVWNQPHGATNGLTNKSFNMT